MSAIVSNKFLTAGSLLLIFLACQPLCLAAKTEAAQKQPAQKQPAVHDMSDRQLVESLRAAKVVDPTYRLEASRVGEELLINTEINPKFNENETKVQAVLIAKTALELLPQTIQRTKILFRNEKEGATSKILVNRPEINSYGKGEITEKTLLGSLELERQDGGQPNASPESTVANGPMQQERLIQLRNIEYLNSKGVDVKNVQKLFAAQEEAAERGNEDSVRKSLRDIASILQEQRNAMRAASTPVVSGYRSGQNGAIGARADGSNLAGAWDTIHKGAMIHRLRLFLDAHGMDTRAETKILKGGNSSDDQKRAAKDSLWNKLDRLPPSVRNTFPFTRSDYKQAPRATSSAASNSQSQSPKQSRFFNRGQQQSNLPLPYHQ